MGVPPVRNREATLEFNEGAASDRGARAFSRGARALSTFRSSAFARRSRVLLARAISVTFRSRAR
jgi:hypothetical protein